MAMDIKQFIANTKKSLDSWDKLYDKYSSLSTRKTWQNFDFPKLSKFIGLMEMLRVSPSGLQSQFLPLEYIEAWNQLRWQFSYVKDGRVTTGYPSPDWDLLHQLIEELHTQLGVSFDRDSIADINQQTWETKEAYYHKAMEKSLCLSDDIKEDE